MNAKLWSKWNDTQVETATPARARPQGKAAAAPVVTWPSKCAAARLIAGCGYGGTSEGIARAAREPLMLFVLTDASRQNLTITPAESFISLRRRSGNHTVPGPPHAAVAAARSPVPDVAPVMQVKY